MSIVGDIVGSITGGAAAATPTGAISAVSSLVETVVERIWADPADRDKARIALRQLEETGELSRLTIEAGLLQGQIDVNKIEASSDSFFKSGWRPFVGWMCGLGVGWAFVGEPVASFAAASLGYSGAFPDLRIADLVGLLVGLLGMAGIRSVDKANGVSS